MTNQYHGEGARGGCYFEIEPAKLPHKAELRVGWSCVVVHSGEIPVTWLTELIAIATAHEGGIEGFLRANVDKVGGHNFAFQCDPPDSDTKMVARKPREGFHSW